MAILTETALKVGSSCQKADMIMYSMRLLKLMILPLSLVALSIGRGDLHRDDLRLIYCLCIRPIQPIGLRRVRHLVLLSYE